LNLLQGEFHPASFSMSLYGEKEAKSLDKSFLTNRYLKAKSYRNQI
jgi:hypothetical protein